MVTQSQHIKQLEDLQNKRFKQKFKGRITLVDKEGDKGIVASTKNPIQKLQER